MKKIMFAIAAIMFAVCAQAGAVKWAATNVYGTDGATKSTGIGYLFAIAGDVTVDSVTAALAGDAASAATYVSANSVSSWTPTVAGNYTPTAGVTYDTGSYNFFAVIFDSTDVAGSSNYYMTTTKNASVPGSGTVSVAFGNQSSATFGKQAWSSTGWSNPIPEPTSGMLLLLGGALLALRRKQK